MYEKVFGPQHRLTVLRLYKTILRLHQGLPHELSALGNQYVRDEFRRHKDAPPEFVTNFMVEWSVSTQPRLRTCDGHGIFSRASFDSSSMPDVCSRFFVSFIRDKQQH